MNPALHERTTGPRAARSALVTRGRLIAAVLIAVLALWVFFSKAAQRMPDFAVYWTAGARAASAEPLYRVEDGHYVFKYLPAFAVLAIPLGVLPQHTAQALWFTISVFFVVVLLAQSIALLVERRRPRWLLATILIVALAKFLGHELVLGQVNLLLGVVAAGALLAIKSGREVLAGGLFVLAIVIKPYAVIFLPWLAARRRLPSLFAALAGVLVVLLLPALIYGWSRNVAEHRAWWAMVTASTGPNLLVADNVSLASACARILGVGALATGLSLATSVALVGVAAVAFLLRGGVRFPEGLEGGLLLTLIPLVSPQGWDYVFLLSAPAIACLANYADGLPRGMRVAATLAVAAIGLSLFDLMGRAAYRAFMEASMITWLYLIVIAALLMLRVRKAA